MKLRYLLAAAAAAGLVAGAYIAEMTSGGAPTTDTTQTGAPDDSAATDSFPVPKRRPEYIPPRTGETYEMAGKRFTVSPAVRDAFTQVEAQYDIPYPAMIAVCARESDCDPGRINSSSGACGLFQFMTNRIETLYEVLWKYGPENGYAAEAGLVERYVSSRDKKGNPYFGYRPVDDKAREQTLALCLDPAFNATMWAAYHRPLYENYNEWLGNREITVGEIVGINNLGLEGLKAFAKQAWEDSARKGEMLAVDFFKAHRNLFGAQVSGNRTLILDGDGKYKTVRQAYNDIFVFGGYKPLNP